MSDLSQTEKDTLEYFFGMGDGSVLNFSTKKLEDFIYESVGVDVCDEKYNNKGSSKAKRLRAIWEQESNQVTGKLLFDLLDYWKNQKLINTLKTRNISEELFNECLKISQRLLGRLIYTDQSAIIYHHFEEIQPRIIEQIEFSRFIIWIAVAWFTDKVIFNNLLDKKDQGVNIQIIINDDVINDNSKLNYEEEFDTYRIPKSGKYENMMHNKFCIIDLSTVIHGSYNWTTKARYNHETVEVIHSRKVAEQFAEQFIMLKLSVDS